MACRIKRSRRFFSKIGWIGTRHPMLRPLPGDPQPAEGEAHGFVADQPRRQALGETDLGSQRERPPAGGLAKRPWALVQQRPEGFADPKVEDHRYGVRPRRLRLEPGE